MKKKLLLTLSIIFMLSLFSGCGDSDETKKDSIQQPVANQQTKQQTIQQPESNQQANKTITIQYSSGDCIIQTMDLDSYKSAYYFGGIIGKDNFSIATRFSTTYNNASACNFYFPLQKGYRFKLPNSKFQLVVSNFDIEKGTIELSEGSN